MPRISALPLLLAATLPLAGAAQAQVAPVAIPANGPVLSLSVTEEVQSTPDLATIGTGVQTRAQTAKEAMRLNAAQMDKLVAAIIKAGIDRKDIQTSGLNLSAQYDYSNRTEAQGPRFIGYEASNQLSVKVRRIDAAGDIVDQMVAAGATNINGPSFGIADDTALVRQAKEKALRTAKERADFYAQATGYRAARLLAVSENSDIARPIPMPMMMRAEAAPATKIMPGQLSTSVTLNLQYVLER